MEERKWVKWVWNNMMDVLTKFVDCFSLFFNFISPEILSFCLSLTLLLLSEEFLPVDICFYSYLQLWSLWLVFGKEKLWETQSRVILLWRDLYQNKQQLHSVHRPGISLARQTEWTNTAHTHFIEQKMAQCTHNRIQSMWNACRKIK